MGDVDPFLGDEDPFLDDRDPFWVMGDPPTETKGYTANFLANEMCKHVSFSETNLTDHQSLINPLKIIFEKSIFDSNLNIPMTALLPTNNNLPKLNIGIIISQILPFIRNSLVAFRSKLNNNQPINSQMYTETKDFFKKIIFIPVKFALKYQKYNTSLFLQTCVTTTGNYQTILDSDTFKLDTSDLDLCLQTFHFEYYYNSEIEQYNNHFIIEYIYELLIGMFQS